MQRKEGDITLHFNATKKNEAPLPFLVCFLLVS